MSRLYEVVILSDSTSDVGTGQQYVQQILMSLDSFQKYQLKGFGHEFYRFSSHGFYKDLSILGRADHNIVAIDLEKQRVLAPHQDNCIILPKFTGSADDDALTKLTPLLIRTFRSPDLSQPKVKDIRKELEKLGADPVDAFRTKIMEKVQKHQPAKRVVAVHSRGSSSLLPLINFTLCRPRLNPHAPSMPGSRRLRCGSGLTRRPYGWPGRLAEGRCSSDSVRMGRASAGKWRVRVGGTGYQGYTRMIYEL